MAETDKQKTNIHRNHRQKVRERFYVNGFRGMPGHNVLEMLLFYGIPYKDTNPIAHELIERFGSFSGVLEAKKTDLMQVKGMTENAACLITMMLPIYQKYSQDLIKKRHKFKTVDELAAFLRPLYIDNSVERVFLLCFDANNRLITYRMIGEGDMSSSSFDMRKLASAVLETNAVSVVLSHNHPHGISAPSYQDGLATAAVANLLHTLNVIFSNHIIIGDRSHFSMVDSPRFVEYFHNFQDEKVVD